MGSHKISTVGEKSGFILSPFFVIYLPLLGLSAEKYVISVYYAFKCDQMHILYVY